MDKATILSDATRYVKELQEKLKDVEAGGSSGRSIETHASMPRPRRRMMAPSGRRRLAHRQRGKSYRRLRSGSQRRT
jgi:hypothetical protein